MTRWHMWRQGGAKGLVLTCALILVVVLGAGCGGGTTGGASATSSVTHTPNATPLPAVKGNAAVLGGAVYAFDTKFGSGNCCYRNGWDYQGPYGAMWTGVEYDGDTSGGLNNFDEQSKVRVKTIENTAVQLTTALWTVSQADAICNPYLPPDAKYKDSISVMFIPGQLKGIEKRYTSALLANSLPASDFTDVNGHTVAPGTFYMFYSATYNGSPTMLVGSCTLSTDENAAQNL